MSNQPNWVKESKQLYLLIARRLSAQAKERIMSRLQQWEKSSMTTETPATSTETPVPLVMRVGALPRPLDPFYFELKKPN